MIDRSKDHFLHKPVLLKKVLEYVAICRDGVYVDATIGLGGHAEAILQHSGPRARLIGIDRDADALDVCRKRLERFGERVFLIRGTFSELTRHIQIAGFGKVNGILFDLGVSSLQFDDPIRGFSFRHEAPLDMRMDSRQDVTAAHLINGLGEDELERMFREHADERYARRIVKSIIQERRKGRITTTTELVRIIERSVPGSYRGGRIHPATKTFQALRMEVNGEMEQLKNALHEVAESLVNEGRFAVISFHSGEDRLVKEYIFNGSRGCVCPPNLPFCVCGEKPSLKNLTKKPIRPDETEIEGNPRARSARMRVAEKIA